MHYVRAVQTVFFGAASTVSTKESKANLDLPESPPLPEGYVPQCPTAVDPMVLRAMLERERSHRNMIWNKKKRKAAEQSVVGIEEASASSFRKALKSEPALVVMFGATWCGAMPHDQA